MNLPVDLPPPPIFPHTDFTVPTFTPWEHPYTKWMLNTFRSGANMRLAAMSKEHPELFRHFFQVPDTPEKVTCDNSDYDAMYKRSTVLYLRPLSLAVYMRRLDVIKLLLDSKLGDNNEISYATDSSGRAVCDDEEEIREIRPVTIAVRRNVLEALPVLFNSNSHLRSFDQFTLRYANKFVARCNRFTDVLDYTISVVRRKRILPTIRVFETLVFRCPGYFNANSVQTLCSRHGGRKCSLFLRLAKYLLSEARGNRLALPLIQSMNQLIQYKGFYRSQKNLDTLWREHYKFSGLSEEWKLVPVILRDRLMTIAIMFKAHEVLHEKIQPLIISHSTRIISKMILALGCQVDLVTTGVAELQKSIQFLLNCAFKPSESVNSQEACGDLIPDGTRQPCSSRNTQGIKAPTKKSLRILMHNLKPHLSSSGAKTKAQLPIHLLCEVVEEVKPCSMCLKECQLRNLSKTSSKITEAVSSRTQSTLVPAGGADDRTVNSDEARDLEPNSDLIAAPLVNEEVNSCQAETLECFQGQEIPQGDFQEHQYEETFLSVKYASADEESPVCSTKISPRKLHKEPCNLVEVDNLIERIVNNTALTNDYLLSDDDSDMISEMLKECLNKTELQFALDSDTSSTDSNCQLESTAL